MNTMDLHVSLNVACVYRLTGPNGKAYIGKTVEPLERRVQAHVAGKSAIGNALRKHGREAFMAEVLLVGTEAYCYEMERRLIKVQRTLAPHGYNLSEGGEGLTSSEARRMNMDPKVRAKMRAAANTPEALEKARRHGNSPKNLENLRRMNTDPRIRAKNHAAADTPERRARLKRMSDLPQTKAARLKHGNSSENLKQLAVAAAHGRVTSTRRATERAERLLPALRSKPEGITREELEKIFDETNRHIWRHIYRLRQLGYRIINISRPGWHRSAIYCLIED